MKNVIRAIGAIAVLFALGFGPARPEVPDNLKAPAGEDVILVGHAKGVQIYVCQNSDCCHDNPAVKHSLRSPQ